MRVSNKQAREMVINRREFKANNIFGEYNVITREGKRNYVVYSYGHHFPLYAYVNGQWYGNRDKYSVTTSKHYNQCNPLVPVILVSTDELNTLMCQ